MAVTKTLARVGLAAALSTAPIAALAQDWTGPSVGLQFGNIDVDTSGAAALSGDNVFYGIRGYYDYDFGDFVIGGGFQYDTTDIGLGGVTTVDSVFRVGARAGAGFGQTYVYGTGGFARVNTSSGVVGDSNGYFVGFGLEYALTDAISLGGEVLYHEFDDFNLAGLDAEATTVGVSLNYRF